MSFSVSLVLSVCLGVFGVSLLGPFRAIVVSLFTLSIHPSIHTHQLLSLPHSKHAHQSIGEQNLEEIKSCKWIDAETYDDRYGDTHPHTQPQIGLGAVGR